MSAIYFIAPPAESFVVIGNELDRAKDLVLENFFAGLQYDADDFPLDAFKEFLTEEYQDATKEQIRAAILSGEILWLEKPGFDAVIMDIACTTSIKIDNNQAFLGRLCRDIYEGAYVEKENFGWFFDLIQEGLDRGTLMEKNDGIETGWVKFAECIMDLEQGPLVMTTDEGFPREDLARVLRGEDYNGFDLDKKWKRCLQLLRSKSYRRIEPGSIRQVPPEDIDAKTIRGMLKK